MLPGKLLHLVDESAVARRLLWFVALARSRLADHPARPALRDTKPLLQMTHGSTPPGRA